MVRVLAVTKNRTASEISSVTSKVYGIGESRLQVFLAKKDDLPDVKKHFIGHVQTNKVRDVVKYFDVIESLDSLKLAKKINEFGSEVYIQVNISREESKYGILPEDVFEFYEQVKTLPRLFVTGLMCIASKENPQEEFRQMKILQKKLGLEHLSMGMTDDYLLAIKEGATEIRIGRGIFEGQFFKKAVKALIYRQGKLLILQRPEGNWDFPGGRIEEGESEEEALKREIKEELNVSSKIIKKSGKWHFFHDGKIDVQNYMCEIFGEIKLSHEHIDYRWVDNPKDYEFKGESVYDSLE